MRSFRVLAQSVEQRDRIHQMRANLLYPCAPFGHFVENSRIIMSTLDFCARIYKYGIIPTRDTPGRMIELIASC